MLSYYKQCRHANNFVHVSNLLDFKATIQRRKAKPARRTQASSHTLLGTEITCYLVKVYAAPLKVVSSAKFGFF